MKYSHTFIQLLEVGSLALQLVLIAFSAWFLPTRLTTRWFGIVIFISLVPFLWLAFAIMAMLLDGLTGNDVPGIGYLLEGLIPGIIGFYIYVLRWREKRA